MSTILCSLETADHSGKLAIGETSKLGHEPRLRCDDVQLPEHSPIHNVATYGRLPCRYAPLSWGGGAEMPRSYFHVKRGQATLLDREGVELADIAEAANEAARRGR